jgi:hypothetical protein
MQCDEEDDEEIWRVYIRSCFSKEMVAKYSRFRIMGF